MPTTAAPPPAGAVLSSPADAEPGRFLSLPGVPILPACEQTIEVTDAQGRPQIDPDTGRPKTRTIRFTEAHLRRIADACNERAKRGNFPVIRLGHTILDERDERKQPPPVGYLENFRVGPKMNPDGTVVDATPHLIADRRIDRADHDDAASYPHRSPEMLVNPDDPGDTHIDGLALLRRPPRHEMSLVLNARESLAPSTPPPLTPNPDPEPPTGANTPEPPTGEESMADETTPDMTATGGDGNADASLTIDQKVDMLIEAMHAILDRLDGADAAPEGDEPPADEPAPEVPVQNEAASGEPFAPGLDSIGGEEGDDDDDTPVQNCSAAMPGKPRSKVMNQRTAPDPTIEARFTRLEAENAKLRKANASLATRVDALNEETGDLILHNDRIGVAALVDTLIAADDLRLDRDKEIERLARIEPAARAADVERMRAHYQRGGTNRAVIATGGPKGGAPVVDSAARRDAVVAHARKHSFRTVAEAAADMTAKGIA